VNDDYDMNEFDILDYKNVKSINIKNCFLFSCLFTYTDMYEGSSHEEIRVPWEESFVENGVIHKQPQMVLEKFFAKNPLKLFKGFFMKSP